MLTFTTEQLYIWVSAFIWPASRVLGLISIAPPFGNASIPIQVRILFGVMISLTIAPSVPVPAALAPMSMTSFMIIAQQLIIGVSLGFVVRIIFAAVEMAGEMTSMSMGLGFATFFDPMTQGRSSAISQLYSLCATMVFLAMNGHLYVISILADSFTTLPITAELITTEGLRDLALWGSKIFSVGLQISLPIIIAMLITNFAMGILTRAAPQLNLFGIGFSITILAGLLLIGMTLPFMLPPLQSFIEISLDMIRHLSNMPTISQSRLQ